MKSKKSTYVDTKEGALILDSHKLSYHYERVKAWENGERIAPISVESFDYDQDFKEI